MWPDLVSNPRPPTCESGALPTALCGPAQRHGRTSVSFVFCHFSCPYMPAFQNVYLQLMLDTEDNPVSLNGNTLSSLFLLSSEVNKVSRQYRIKYMCRDICMLFILQQNYFF